MAVKLLFADIFCITYLLTESIDKACFCSTMPLKQEKIICVECISSQYLFLFVVPNVLFQFDCIARNLLYGFVTRKMLICLMTKTLVQTFHLVTAN